MDSTKGGEFLHQLMTISFSRKTLLRVVRYFISWLIGWLVG